MPCEISNNQEIFWCPIRNRCFPATFLWKNEKLNLKWQSIYLIHSEVYMLSPVLSQSLFFSPKFQNLLQWKQK